MTLPVIRLLASVPSVVYGLIGVLVLVPFVGNDLIHDRLRAVRHHVIPADRGRSRPALGRDPDRDDHADHDGADHRCAGRRFRSSCHAGAIALGLNPLRATRAVSLRAIRPAIIAATALATARAIGEVIIIHMVSGGNASLPAQAPGRVDLHLRAVAHARLGDHRPGRETLSAPAIPAPSIYAIALLLMFSGFMLSLSASRLARRPLRKYERIA